MALRRTTSRFAALAALLLLPFCAGEERSAAARTKLIGKWERITSSDGSDGKLEVDRFVFHASSASPGERGSLFQRYRGRRRPDVETIDREDLFEQTDGRWFADEGKLALINDTTYEKIPMLRLGREEFDLVSVSADEMVLVRGGEQMRYRRMR